MGSTRGSVDSVFCLKTFLAPKKDPSANFGSMRSQGPEAAVCFFAFALRCTFAWTSGAFWELLGDAFREVCLFCRFLKSFSTVESQSSENVDGYLNKSMMDKESSCKKVGCCHFDMLPVCVFWL